MLSVIVSTRNDERGTVATLAALVAGATAGLVTDVVLLDAQGGEIFRRIADAAGCNLVVDPAPRDDGVSGRGLIQAAGLTRAPWLLFLAGGAVPQPGWIEEVTQFIEDHTADPKPRGGVLRSARRPAAQRRRRGTAAPIWAWWPSRSRTEKALLISRTHYDRLGGHAATGRRAEAKLLARLGWRARTTLHSRITVV